MEIDLFIESIENTISKFMHWVKWGALVIGSGAIVIGVKNYGNWNRITMRNMIIGGVALVIAAALIAWMLRGE